ncbi:unnamed protein product [Brassica oleracea]|uniref:(rape) hypothetical protein n=1 Tax=Brassica napus TaxID=3708 RepID=A0A816QFX9_BRANA|nr:unnamed protein product [Brassica napus]
MRRTTWTYITNIPPQHLEWNRRKHLICKEISRYNPSILCLQAIDRFDDLDGLLKNRGFRGVHKGLGQEEPKASSVIEAKDLGEQLKGCQRNLDYIKTEKIKDKPSLSIYQLLY